MSNTLRIYYDNSPVSPRDLNDDGLSTMICFHRRYSLGDSDHGYESDDYESWDHFREELEKDFKGGVILPVYLYDHGGLTLRTTPFNCPWDSGQVGFIVASADAIRKLCGVKRISAKLRENIEEQLRDEVRLYSYFVEGNVYRFEIVDESGDIVDSCGGFYGHDWETNGIKDYIPSDLWDQLDGITVF